MVSSNGFTLPEVEQIALIVKDLEQTAAYLSDSLGIAPFTISERHSPTKVDGKPAFSRRKLGIASMGGIELELIQALEEGTPYYDFITANGEVLQHIRFAPVKNLDETVSHLEEKGFRVRYSGDYSGSRFAYLGSEKARGLILEFVQRGLG
jgi:hypothetical protein